MLPGTAKVASNIHGKYTVGIVPRLSSTYIFSSKLCSWMGFSPSVSLHLFHTPEAFHCICLTGLCIVDNKSAVKGRDCWVHRGLWAGWVFLAGGGVGQYCIHVSVPPQVVWHCWGKMHTTDKQWATFKGDLLRKFLRDRVMHIFMDFPHGLNTPATCREKRRTDCSEQQTDQHSGFSCWNKS